MNSNQFPQFTLEPVSGAKSTPSTSPPDLELVVIGRAVPEGMTIEDPRISRRHASLEWLGNNWFISDHGSRHGTFLNGIQLEDSHRLPVEEGDLIAFGPSSYRFGFRYQVKNAGIPTTDDRAQGSCSVRTLQSEDLGNLARQRLDLLLACSQRIHSATSEKELAEQVVEAVMEGTGFPRAAFIRRIPGSDENIEILAAQQPIERNQSTSPSSNLGRFTFSRSLLSAATAGKMVRLTNEGTDWQGESIIQMKIADAVCAPIRLGQSTVGYLYVDARQDEQQAQPEALAFLEALAQMASFALANLKRIEIEHRHDLLESELNAAREVQQLILPAEQGSIGRVQYAMKMIPGRYVAGDLFDVIQLPDSDRVAILLGDVTGKGASAAMVMGVLQSRIESMLHHDPDPAAVVNELNRYLTLRLKSKFATLFFGIIDPAQATLTFIDAGHGYCILCPPDGEPTQLTSKGGIPIGIFDDETYANGFVDFPIHSRLLLFSDGMAEEKDSADDFFGFDRIINALAHDQSPEQDVEATITALKSFALTPSFADDVTVASVTLHP